MSRRHLIREYQVFDSSDSTTDPVSTHTDVSGVDKIAYRLSIGASVNAILHVKVCNKDYFSATDSFELDFEETLTLNGGIDTEYLVSIDNQGFKFLFLEVTNNGGTGNIDAWITGLSVGA